MEVSVPEEDVIDPRATSYSNSKRYGETYLIAHDTVYDEKAYSETWETMRSRILVALGFAVEVEQAAAEEVVAEEPHDTDA